MLVRVQPWRSCDAICRNIPQKALHMLEAHAGLSPLQTNTSTFHCYVRFLDGELWPILPVQPHKIKGKKSGKHVSMTRATRDEWRPKNPTWNAPAKGFSHEGSQKADGFCRRITERRLQNGIRSDRICWSGFLWHIVVAFLRPISRVAPWLYRNAPHKKAPQSTKVSKGCQYFGNSQRLVETMHHQHSCWSDSFKWFGVL